MNLFDVTGKTVLITGGSSGIGKMIARGFVESGARVLIASRDLDACQAVAKELRQFGECIALEGDVSHSSGISGLVDQVSAHVSQLDTLINNAGATWAAPIDEFPASGWDKTMDVNLKGVFFLTQALLPLLRAAATRETPARIINIASVNGLVPPATESYAYAASKGGCILLTRHLAKRLARENILVNAIAPGPFVSRMMTETIAQHGDLLLSLSPLRRLGTPEDIAGVAIFLASRASAYTTGATVPCDGGMAEF